MQRDPACEKNPAPPVLLTLVWQGEEIAARDFFIF
jgi:hypothetical protein